MLLLKININTLHSQNNEYIRTGITTIKAPALFLNEIELTEGYNSIYVDSTILSNVQLQINTSSAKNSTMKMKIQIHSNAEIVQELKKTIIIENNQYLFNFDLRKWDKNCNLLIFLTFDKSSKTKHYEYAVDKKN